MYPLSPRCKLIVATIICTSFLIRLKPSRVEHSVSRYLQTEDNTQFLSSLFDKVELEKLSALRYVTFGASRTWGAGIGSNRFRAYPYLLSVNVTNLAIRATGPEFPALCAYTMLGDDTIADVIILEFFLDAKNNLLRLAKRLRQRYPHATIIFLRIWGPLQYKYISDGPGTRLLKQWLPAHSISSIWDGEFKATMMMENPDDWSYVPHYDVIDAQNEAIEASGGFLYELQRPSDPRVALSEYAYIFAEDMVHLSIQGHTVVANSIRRMLLDLNATRSDDIHPWASTDQCESWYENGNHPSLAKLHPMISMNKFSTDHSLQLKSTTNVGNGKYALEITGSNQWIRLHNPLGQPADIFIRYMGEGPPPGRYSKIRIVLGVDDKVGVIVDPTVYDFDHTVHVNRVTKIGTIPPGYTMMRFTTLEHEKVAPFRITGLVITPPDALNAITTALFPNTMVTSTLSAIGVHDAKSIRSVSTRVPDRFTKDVPMSIPDLSIVTSDLMSVVEAIVSTPETIVTAFEEMIIPTELVVPLPDNTTPELSTMLLKALVPHSIASTSELPNPTLEQPLSSPALSLTGKTQLAAKQGVQS